MPTQVSASVSVNEKRAKDALVHFHNRALQYPENYSVSFDELLNALRARSANFLNNFGAALDAANLPERRVREGMEALADLGKGKLPRRSADWFDFILDGMENIRFSEALKGAVADTVKSVGGVAEAGLTGIKWSLYSLPVILLVGVAVVAFVKSGGKVGGGSAA